MVAIVNVSSEDSISITIDIRNTAIIIIISIFSIVIGIITRNMVVIKVWNYVLIAIFLISIIIIIILFILFI